MDKHVEKKIVPETIFCLHIGSAWSTTVGGSSAAHQPTNCSDRRSQGGRCGRLGPGPWVSTSRGGRASSHEVLSQDRPGCWLKRRRSFGPRRQTGNVALLPARGVSVAEGTSGAAVRAFLSRGSTGSGPTRCAERERGTPGGSVRKRGPYRRAVEPRRYSSRGPTRIRDRRCPGLSGWGKSTAASGRRGGGRRGGKAKRPLT